MQTRSDETIGGSNPETLPPKPSPIEGVRFFGAVDSYQRHRVEQNTLLTNTGHVDFYPATGHLLVTTQDPLNGNQQVLINPRLETPDTFTQTVRAYPCLQAFKDRNEVQVGWGYPAVSEVVQEAREPSRHTAPKNLNPGTPYLYERVRVTPDGQEEIMELCAFVADAPFSDSAADGESLICVTFQPHALGEDGVIVIDPQSHEPHKRQNPDPTSKHLLAVPANPSPHDAIKHKFYQLNTKSPDDTSDTDVLESLHTPTFDPLAGTGLSREQVSFFATVIILQTQFNLAHLDVSRRIAALHGESDQLSDSQILNLYNQANNHKRRQEASYRQALHQVVERFGAQESAAHLAILFESQFRSFDLQTQESQLPPITYDFRQVARDILGPEHSFADWPHNTGNDQQRSAIAATPLWGEPGFWSTLGAHHPEVFDNLLTLTQTTHKNGYTLRRYISHFFPDADRVIARNARA